MSREITAAGRYIILAAAFLGWMASGIQMSLTRLAAGSATEEFGRHGWLTDGAALNWRNLLVVDSSNHPTTQASEVFLKRQKPKWYALYDSAFLLGAATGGLVFGWLGDRAGRVRSMGASIFCYSMFAGAGYAVLTPEQLLVCRFLSGLGIGGMWPTGVSLAAEAWSDVSRPLLSGLLGTSANVGIVLMSIVSYCVPLNADSWRWVMLVGMSPVFLAFAVWALVPESPAWLAARDSISTQRRNTGTLKALFTPPLLSRTVIGILLGTIPLLGGWGVTAWLISWTEAEMGTMDHRSRAMTSLMRAGGATIGSLAGGWIANLVGRRTTYFLVALGSFALSEYIYLRLDPHLAWFSPMVFLVGLVSTIFFGWLPLYLPELFPTHARATGTGIAFNFGRYLTAAGVLGTGVLTAWFQGNYRVAGSVMSLIYALGMVIILFAPDTTGKKLAEDA